MGRWAPYNEGSSTRGVWTRRASPLNKIAILTCSCTPQRRTCALQVCGRVAGPRVREGTHLNYAECERIRTQRLDETTTGRCQGSTTARHRPLILLVDDLQHKGSDVVFGRNCE